MSEQTKCCECENDIDDESMWSSVKQEMICWSCYESDTSSMSTLFYVAINADEWTPPSSRKYYVGDLVSFNEYGDEIDGLVVSRKWVNSGGYRGFNVTEVEGWVTVLDGWTTGGWGDSTAQRKQTFNQWMEDVISGEIVPPFSLIFICDPTSNVFSTAVSVLVEEQNETNFKQWLGVEFDTLYDSLT